MQNNTDENFNEDFERLLKQFVSEKYKDVKLDDMQTEDDKDPFLEDEDVDEDVDEYEAEDNTLPFIHIFDNSQHLTFAEEIVKSCFESCISWT